MKRWLAARPWIWIVAALTLVVIVDLVFLVFAEVTAPPVLTGCGKTPAGTHSSFSAPC
jgi:hypothetical protein